MSGLTVRQHDDGTWYCRPYLGTNKVTGKPIRPYRRFPEATTEEEALAAAQEWVNGLSGATALRTSMELAEILTRYVDHLETSNKPANTVKTYRGFVRRCIEPFAGGIAADEFRPYLVEALYDALLSHGRADGGPLSPNTVIQLHWFLCGAYKWMVSKEITPFNPMPSVQKPHPTKVSATAYGDAEIAKLTEALDGMLADPSTDKDAIRMRTAAFAAYLSLWTGERCGEVCANTVADADLAACTMHIGSTIVEAKGRPFRQQGTKDGKSRNVSISPQVCARLRDHYLWQSGFLPDAVADDAGRTICCTPAGGIMRPSEVSRTFSELRDRIGLPRETSFHTLRHTHATRLLVAGVDMRTVQERLGHADVNTTLRLYMHVLPGRDRAAADAFEASVGGARGPSTWHAP